MLHCVEAVKNTSPRSSKCKLLNVNVNKNRAPVPDLDWQPKGRVRVCFMKQSCEVSQEYSPTQVMWDIPNGAQNNTHPATSPFILAVVNLIAVVSGTVSGGIYKVKMFIASGYHRCGFHPVHRKRLHDILVPRF